MIRQSRWIPVTFVACLLGGPLSAQDAKPNDSKPDPGQLEKEFTELLTNSVLVGRFTTDGQEGTPKEDRYSIGKVGKVQGQDDSWVFTGIKYGKKDISFPIVIKVVFADGTPMMSMDEMKIEGLGTFSFRILFHGNRYAGSWQHDDHGGHMWGRVEKQKPDDKKTSLSDRLNQKVTVSYKGAMLYKVLEALGKVTDVKFEIQGDDLKMEGITQNMQQNIELEDQPAKAVLDRMLTPLKLCVVADEKKGVVYVTSEAAATRRGWTPLILTNADDKRSGARLEDRLKRRIKELNFRQTPVRRCLDEIGTAINVRFEVLDDDLKAQEISFEEVATFRRENWPADRILHALLRPLRLCVVADKDSNVVKITTWKAAMERDWDMIPLPDSSYVADRLQGNGLHVGNLTGKTLAESLTRLGQLMEVTFEPFGDDLTAAGVTLSMKVVDGQFERTRPAQALAQLLKPLDLCLVVDEENTVAYVTTTRAAENRGWQILPLE